tara:strand:- start:9356 stop:9760 length:405 start_codon:yes stop_codon:yes gene_type:complete
MPGTVTDRIIFSVAIVYSESLFQQVRQNQQHLAVSLIAVLFAVFAERAQRSLEACFAQEQTTLWHKIVSQWLEIGQMTLTFIAIHSIVEVVNTMITQNERFYYEALLFPIITITLAVSLVTIAETKLESKCKGP